MLVDTKQARCLLSCADVVFPCFPSLCQCPAGAVPMGTPRPRATPRGRAASAPAREPSAPPRASRRERAPRGKGRPRATSTPATGKRLCFLCRNNACAQGGDVGRGGGCGSCSSRSAICDCWVMKGERQKHRLEQTAIAKSWNRGISSAGGHPQ